MVQKTNNRMPGKISSKSTNKARILKLVPKIISMRQEGYYLTDIYKWLRDSDQVNCSFGNFKKYYYEFAKTQLENLDSGSLLIEEPDVASNPNNADSAVGAVDPEGASHVGQPRNESVTVLIVPCDLFDLLILK